MTTEDDFSMFWRAYPRRISKGAARTAFGEPKRYLTEVVLAYDGDECLPWPYARSGDGRGAIRLDGRQQIVSRHVCERVHGPAPTPEHEAAHSCGNGGGGCVTKRHLSWKTPAGNSADRLIHGTHARGTQNGRAKLTEKQVQEIQEHLKKSKLAQSEIGKMFGVSSQTVSLIHTGQHWACRA